MKRAALWLAALALLPRLPFVFLHNGQCDADGSVATARTWLAGAGYSQRWPGSPVYDLPLGLLDRLASAIGVPYYYLSNLFSVLCVFVTLIYLRRIFARFLPPGRALLAVALFNFYPQEWVIGASTYELNLLMAFLAAGFWYYLEGRVALAMACAILALGSKIMGLALAAPLGCVLVWRSLRAGRPGEAALRSVVSVAGVLVVFSPVLRQHGLLGFFDPFFHQVYHQDLSASTKLGAFANRTLNLFGFLGFPLLAWAAFRSRERLGGFVSEAGVVTAAYAMILLAIMVTSPWETYYLLPLVPVGVLAAFVLSARRPVELGAFAASLLLGNLVQLQLKPWKWPPVHASRGVIESHVKQDWNTRGGG